MIHRENALLLYSKPTLPSLTSALKTGTGKLKYQKFQSKAW